jgi:hypothetical protein
MVSLVRVPRRHSTITNGVAAKAAKRNRIDHFPGQQQPLNQMIRVSTPECD